MIARPIAEMPKELKDGRRVHLLFNTGMWDWLKYENGNWNTVDGYSYEDDYFTHFAKPPIMPVEHPLGHLTPQDCTPEQFKEFWEAQGWDCTYGDDYACRWLDKSELSCIRLKHWCVRFELVDVVMPAIECPTLSEAATTAEALARVLGGWK